MEMPDLHNYLLAVNTVRAVGYVFVGLAATVCAIGVAQGIWRYYQERASSDNQSEPRGGESGLKDK